MLSGPHQNTLKQAKGAKFTKKLSYLHPQLTARIAICEGPPELPVIIKGAGSGAGQVVS